MSEFQKIIIQFQKSEQGSLAIFFAITIMLLAIVVSMSVDGARAVNAYTRAGNALDAASLAAAKAMNDEGLPDAELYTIAKTIFDENTQDLSRRGIKYKNLNLQIDRNNSTVKATVEGEVQTTFAQIMNIPKIDIGNTSTATYNIKDIELAMMLDVTGSMRGSKIDDLKEAATQLVDILIQDESQLQKTRIALAPYAASVNTGSYANEVSGGTSRDGCVYERDNRYAFSEVAPGRNSFFNTMRNPRRPSNRQYGCPQAEILPLTDDKRQIKRNINNFRVGGYTAGHLGTAWAWYLISPEWANIWPSSSRPVEYSDKKTIKVAILMTDGEFNTSYLNGRANRTSSTQAQRLCENMKAEGIQLYSVAFQAPSSAQRTLKACASSTGHYFNATNGDELIRTFKDIAVRLSKLRISE